MVPLESAMVVVAVVPVSETAIAELAVPITADVVAGLVSCQVPEPSLVKPAPTVLFVTMPVSSLAS